MICCGANATRPPNNTAKVKSLIAQPKRALARSASPLSTRRRPSAPDPLRTLARAVAVGVLTAQSEA